MRLSGETDASMNDYNYEIVPEILRTVAAIYTAVVVVWNNVPNIPNSEFRVLLRLFTATA
jgi:hypothetical protein